MNDVVIGPSVDMHPGIHGAILETPPAGIRYVPRSGVQCLALPREELGVCEQLSLADVVRLGTGSEVVHSARWPVIDCRSWVVDFEDFGYPILLGQCAWNSSLAAQEGPLATRTPAFAQHLQWRSRNMCAALAHESCKAILVYTDHERREILSLLAGLNIPDWRDRVSAKLRVLYPAVPAIAPNVVLAKWKRPRPLRIVFCGRYYDWKNGELALNVLARLRRRYPIETVYIGDIPDATKVSRPELMTGIEHCPALPRRAVLQHLAEAHVLFHPSRSESLGAILLEAASAGCAILCGAGDGMPHITELFGDDAALLMERGRPELDEEREFENLLCALCDDVEMAQRVALAAYELTTSGRLSVSARDRVLNDAYRECRQDRSEAALSLEALPHCDATERWWVGRPEKLRDERHAFCSSIGVSSSLVRFSLEFDSSSEAISHMGQTEGDGYGRH